jgi:hypothetical protein
MVEAETPHRGSSSNTMQQKLHEERLVAMCDAIVEDDSSENAWTESSSMSQFGGGAFDIEQPLLEVEFDTSTVEALQHENAHHKTMVLQEEHMLIEQRWLSVEKFF